VCIVHSLPLPVSPSFPPSPRVPARVGRHRCLQRTSEANAFYEKLLLERVERAGDELSILAPPTAVRSGRRPL